VALALHGLFAVRQAAAYGIGAVAQEHADVMAPYVAACLPALSKVIRETKRVDSGAEAHDNAVCALGKMIHHLVSRRACACHF
jgi:hypothetical protein